MIWTGFESGTPGRKANTITTELKRILFNAVVRYCISIGKQPCLKEWSPVTAANKDMMERIWTNGDTIIC